MSRKWTVVIYVFILVLNVLIMLSNRSYSDNEVPECPPAYEEGLKP
jgi:hypothetical protein